jgi:hypothetical protein
VIDANLVGQIKRDAYGGLDRAALARMFPAWPNVGSLYPGGARGIVLAWNAQDDDYGWQTGDIVSGEIRP